MIHLRLRRGLIAGALAAILATAGAAPAQARDLGPASRAWLWLQDVWTQRISILWSGSARTEVKGTPYREKEGPGFDPNGLTAPRPNSASPVCGTCTDEGPGFDPNG